MGQLDKIFSNINLISRTFLIFTPDFRRICKVQLHLSSNYTMQQLHQYNKKFLDIFKQADFQMQITKCWILLIPKNLIFKNYNETREICCAQLVFRLYLKFEKLPILEKITNLDFYVHRIFEFKIKKTCWICFISKCLNI